MMVPAKMDVQENVKGTWLNSFNVPIETHSLSDLQLNGRCLSGDEQFPKVRKPYTITKQREKWTEEEHKKFLEALQLHGRNWRLIEEHIGTKTAIQIRSHAQKFFSKIVRESNNNDGTSSLKATDIPPPRPKRKHLHPYPRKLGNFPCKSIAVPKKAEMPPQLFSGCEPASRSPTSVLSPMPNHHNGYTIPGSSADGSSDEENECQSPILTIEENRTPSLGLAIGGSSVKHDNDNVSLHSLPEENANSEQTSSAEAQTIKLFGKTIVINGPQKASPCNPSSAIQFLKPMCVDWQTAPVGTQPPFNSVPFSGEHNSIESGIAHLAWSILWRNTPFLVLSPSSSLNAEAESGQEIQRGSSC